MRNIYTRSAVKGLNVTQAKQMISSPVNNSLSSGYHRTDTSSKGKESDELVVYGCSLWSAIKLPAQRGFKHIH